MGIGILGGLGDSEFEGDLGIMIWARHWEVSRHPASNAASSTRPGRRVGAVLDQNAYDHATVPRPNYKPTISHV